MQCISGFVDGVVFAHSGREVTTIARILDVTGRTHRGEVAVACHKNVESFSCNYLKMFCISLLSTSFRDIGALARPGLYTRGRSHVI